MTKRHIGYGLLAASAIIWQCCARAVAEEGPILPGLDAIPNPPPYVADPPAASAGPRPRRSLRAAAPPAEVEREPSTLRNNADEHGETSPDAKSPSAKRTGIRGLFPEKPADRPPLSRSPANPESDRTKSLGRTAGPRGMSGDSNAAPSMRRGPGDPRSLDRAPIGDRREPPLSDPWGASRQQADPRSRAALEREKAWRAGQDQGPAANPRSPRASSAPSRSPQSGRQGNSSQTSPRTGQPSGNRFSR